MLHIYYPICIFRITEWLSSEETSESLPTSNPLRRGDSQSVTQDYVEVPFEDLWGKDSKTSLGNLFQCSLIFTVTKCFLIFKWNILCSNLCLLLPELLLRTSRMILDTSSSTLPSGIYLYRYSMIISFLSMRDVPVSSST